MAGSESKPGARAAVALVACPDYGETHVMEALRRGVGLLGGIALFARRSENILLKPNLLVGPTPLGVVGSVAWAVVALWILLRQPGEPAEQ